MAVSRTPHVAGDVGSLFAATEGYRWAFAVTVAFAVFGLAGAALLLGRAPARSAAEPASV